MFLIKPWNNFQEHCFLDTHKITLFICFGATGYRYWETALSQILIFHRLTDYFTPLNLLTKNFGNLELAKLFQEIGKVVTSLFPTQQSLWFQIKFRVKGDCWKTWEAKCQSNSHIETIQLICSTNQLGGFYMTATSALNELMEVQLTDLWISIFPSYNLHYFKIKKKIS